MSHFTTTTSNRPFHSDNNDRHSNNNNSKNSKNDGDHLPQPQNSNHLSTAPFRDKLLTNSSYLAAEIPLKLGHWVSHLWQQHYSTEENQDTTLYLLGQYYDMPNMVKMQQDILNAQSETFFDNQHHDTNKENKQWQRQQQLEQEEDSNNNHPQEENSGIKVQKEAVAPSLSMMWPPAFYDDFTTRFWMTYRHNYPPIRPSNYKTDIGWGCMLRSGQSLLANALLIHCLGRDWRRRGNEKDSQYLKIIQWFLDELSPRAPFSIHRIALLGKQLGKNIGEWFGPSTISQVILALVSDFPAAQLAVYIATDGVVYRNAVEDAATGKRPRGEFSSTYQCRNQEAREIYDQYTPDDDVDGIKGKQECQKEDEEFQSILILVAIRLGIDQLHPTYYPALKTCFELPWFVGIAGGRPNSSLYFLGMQGDDLIYMDPHFSRTALETKSMHDYDEESISTYHCTIPRKIHISHLDPSMLLGFYCRTRQEFDDFCDHISQIATVHTPIFTIEKHAPEYDEDVRSENDFGILSDDDEEEDDGFGDEEDRRPNKDIIL
ncbi:hypothetical protein BDA99DRAFT_521030 [Phascolomyces articulosus]|uniref:Cysteine protease n=1 Tax=Phascolomyces articulosus TaxID=60185 RepID=A0AAD5K2B4_9FUNG|nr:hypothetical protein BDA99DRAFT_521030 [Phascolomyces articulosus]